ncbi:hypothetical protein yaldo0001_15560 [Yersinia aldovae ATCC 35236]|nr:hypothetical protein yaldo0001_15560 [Yersinia aldovae ATCC 35236]
MAVFMKFIHFIHIWNGVARKLLYTLYQVNIFHYLLLTE